MIPKDLAKKLLDKRKNWQETDKIPEEKAFDSYLAKVRVDLGKS